MRMCINLFWLKMCLVQWLVGFVIGVSIFLGLTPLTQAESVPSTGDSENGKEEWLAMFVGDQRIGFAFVQTKVRNVNGKKHFITQSEQRIKLKRMGVDVEINLKSQVTEDSSGKVLNFVSQNAGAGSDRTIKGYRVGAEFVLISEMGESSRIPASAEDFGPAKVDQLTRAIELVVGAKVSVRGLLVEMGVSSSKMDAEVLRQEEKIVAGKPRKLWNVRVIMDFTPNSPLTLWVDEKRDVILGEQDMPGIGLVRLEQSTRADAMLEISGTEAMATSLIRPNKPLTNLSALKSATYRIQGERPLEIVAWDGEQQKVIEKGEGFVVLRIEAMPTTLAASYILPVTPSEELKPFLSSSIYVDSQNKMVEALAKRAVGDEKDARKAALKIEETVRSYVTKKDLNVGFASAGETAESRQGDCTEHAVLCAAMARAVGLPSRLVVGLGYLPTDFHSVEREKKEDVGVFGMHMWAEAKVSEKDWQAMDAALGKFNVGHIAIHKTPLDDGQSMSGLYSKMAEWMMGIKIEVKELR